MRFMITLGFAVADDDRATVAALVPKELAHLAALTERGVVEGFYLSADRARGWLVMRGESQAAVARLLEEFPLYRYMQPSFTPLA